MGLAGHQVFFFKYSEIFLDIKKNTFCSLFGFSDVNNAFDVTLNVPILSAVREAQKCLS